MRVYFSIKEALVLIRALSLILNVGSADESRTAQTLLERINRCRERQGYKPRMKG